MRNFRSAMSIKIFISTAVLGLAGLILKAEAPKYSNEFLSIGVGGRAWGMGGAQAASASTASKDHKPV